MGRDSAIEWTDHTFNAWWGCEKVSPACRDCYAETLANRFHPGLWGPVPRKLASEKTWREPEKWFEEALEAGVQRRVFCLSMGDIFEDREDLVAPRERLVDLAWRTIALGSDPGLIWMCLTKRPENVKRLLANTKLGPLVDGPPADRLHRRDRPDPHFWFGVTAENQEWLDRRADHLAAIRCRVRFVSCEPLLGPLDFCSGCPGCGTRECVFRRIDWVIAGGESGQSARPAHPDWFRSIRNQCAEAGVPFFFKQWGEWRPKLASVAGLPTPVCKRGKWGTLKPSGQLLRETTPWNGRELEDATGRECVVVAVGKRFAGAELDSCSAAGIPTDAGKRHMEKKFEVAATLNFTVMADSPEQAREAVKAWTDVRRGEVLVEAQGREVVVNLRGQARRLWRSTVFKVDKR